ncbi:acyl-CoA thioesterase/bile acid-CoA:amino acid N-acyltransferase family protein [Saccharothrix yanglingensis]|uniref:Palmitoyl-CoA hydrolase n=1 Tax=Saccharothrix yanglingensis TaxID=659496 RepID=A0ABU0X1P1_9PSEU|nr:acyl-CoA thioester hydrolase/BAAT C-terminal domain-containing protein [Saccharothrix yanglingensis]MDQ2586044.1 palmitoyl-CoA hydrolase [Saccharothrix yanglingensis]
MAELLVTPTSAPLDAPLRIRVEGLGPDAEVTVRATTGDRAAEAVFRADERGVVDLTRHAPVSGDYSGVDPMGLFWSMTPTGGTPRGAAVEASGVGRVEVERLTVPDGVKRTEVAERGLVGVLFEPADAETHPGVLVLGGSEGGLHEDDAALLASHGFAALALAYFGAPGVPDDLVEIPLEYFGTALEWLGGRADALGVLGGSRGGELALLLGATFPRVEAVVSVVGSGVVTQCVGPGSRLLRKLEHEAASWTSGGRPLPYLPYSVPDELRAAVVDGEPVPLRLAFDLSDGVPEDVEIPVERINGGVLLLSSGDDQSWPCAELSAVAERRLREHDHPFPHEHVVYPGAGHLIAGPPHRPTTDTVVPGPGVRFRMGGTPAATAAARADAWRRTVEFLSDRLRA